MKPYARYGLRANQGGTYLATFRAVAKKYPHKSAGEILGDLVKTTPGSEGKWFAAAKEAGLFTEALALATLAPCDPKTLARAARDFAEKEPAFAVGAGQLSLHWLVKGYGYEVTGLDVWGAYHATLAAADRNGTAVEIKERIRQMIAGGGAAGSFVSQVLARELGLGPYPVWSIPLRHWDAGLPASDRAACGLHCLQMADTGHSAGRKFLIAAHGFAQSRFSARGSAMASAVSGCHVNWQPRASAENLVVGSQQLKWGGQRDSNPRPLDSQSSALTN